MKKKLFTAWVIGMLIFSTGILLIMGYVVLSSWPFSDRTARSNIEYAFSEEHAHRYQILCCADNRYSFVKSKPVVKNGYVVGRDSYFPVPACYVVETTKTEKVRIGLGNRVLKDTVRYQGKRLDVPSFLFFVWSDSEIFLHNHKCFLSVDWWEKSKEIKPLPELSQEEGVCSVGRKCN